MADIENIFSLSDERPSSTKEGWSRVQIKYINYKDFYLLLCIYYLLCNCHTAAASQLSGHFHCMLN